MQDISAHIMDIAQNSVRANATKIEIDVEEDFARDTYTILIQDNGEGMDASTLNRVTDPFFTSRTVRKVGLGIPLLKQNAEATGGKLTIDSIKGSGTTTKAVFVHSHLDRPPTGDIPGVIVLLAAANPETEIIYRYSNNRGEYVFNSREVREVLDGTPMNDPEIIQALREMIRENTEELSTPNQS